MVVDIRQCRQSELMIIENEMVKRGSILILIKEEILIKEREILRDFNIAHINNHLNFESLQAYFTQFSFEGGLP